MHYLTSRNHPVCGRCSVGFPTDQEYAEVGGAGGVPAIYEPLWRLTMIVFFRNIAQFRITFRTAVQDLRAAVPNSGGIKGPYRRLIESSPVRVL
jgi:hypothetical protein